MLSVTATWEGYFRGKYREGSNDDEGEVSAFGSSKNPCNGRRKGKEKWKMLALQGGGESG